MEVRAFRGARTFRPADGCGYEELPIDVQAHRLGTTRNALYKTLHDARRRLRTALTAHGHLEMNFNRSTP